MSALGLGLALVEREPSIRRQGGRLDALRTQVGRAVAAIDELDRLRGAGAADDAERPTQLLDLASLVSQRARAWSQLAPAYGARLRLSWRAGSVAYPGDRSRLEQAIDNLIANALEHGGRQVVVEGSRRGGALLISIWDSGTGLSHQPDGLAQAGPRSPRGHGLAIARAAIEWHGGRLSFSRRDGGATVDIQLPIDPAEELQALPTRCAGPESGIGSAPARAA
jgi:signal transduction histidine kinase